MLSLTDAPQLFASLKGELTETGLVSLIKLHMNLAEAIARRFCKNKEKEHDEEEYFAVACLALVEAVHNAFRYMTHDNITGYIVLYVRRALLKHYREDRVVVIGSRTQSRWFRLGYLIRPHREKLNDTHVGVIESNDLLDALIELLPNLIDRQVLTLRLEAHTDIEISVLLNKDVKIIRKIRNKIKRVLLEVLTEDDE